MYIALSQRRSSRPICPCVPRRLIVWNKIGEFSEALNFPGRTNALTRLQEVWRWILKFDTSTIHRVTTKNRNNFQNIFVKSFSWVGSLLRDHTRWTETQLQGSKMDSLDSFAQITLLFNKLVSRMKTLQFCSDDVRWDWRSILGGWLSQLSVNWWVRGKMLCGFLPRFPPSQ